MSTTTAAAVFLNSLADAGVTHVFVNWGNDHPAILEELERQRVEHGRTKLEIVTCPNEMVALSAAQGFTQVSGVPSAVIVHVDVGTQALAGAVHNADRGRVPVLIFAGMSPFSANGELKGSKNEWPMWLQDVPDQSAILRQYMRYTTQIMSGKNLSKVVLRSLQIAKSEPQGPVYLFARREVFEEDIDVGTPGLQTDPSKWPSIRPTALDPTTVETISSALIGATFPLILAGHTGRNTRTVPLLSELSSTLAIALCMAAPSAVSVPYTHPHFLGTSFGTHNAVLEEADVVLVLDADVPWIDAKTTVRKDARVFVLDPDPLKPTYGWMHVDAECICRADAEVALTQILEHVRARATNVGASVHERAKQLTARHEDMLSQLSSVGSSLQSPDKLEAAYVLAALREVVAAKTPSYGARTLWLNEGISNYPAAFDHIQPSIPGSMIASGGSSLGWALGAAVGASLADQGQHDIMVAVIGDGTFLFGVPSSAYWMARRYNTPYLTIILNNGGWASPKNSMMGIYPTGHGSKADGARLSIGFGPEMPDYAGIAAAAGGAWGRRVSEPEKLRGALEEAIHAVLIDKRCAVVDCIVRSI